MLNSNFAEIYDPTLLNKYNKHLKNRHNDNGQNKIKNKHAVSDNNNNNNNNNNFKKKCRNNNYDNEFYDFSLQYNQRFSNCPNNEKLLNKFHRLDYNYNKNIIVVGCNKGFDAINIFSQYNTLLPNNYTTYKWINALNEFKSKAIKIRNKFNSRKIDINLEGVCKKGRNYNYDIYDKYINLFNTAAIATTNTKNNLKLGLPNVYCIEPMKSNYLILKYAAHYNKLPNNKFHILQYAIGMPNKNEKLIYFSKGYFGKETGGSIGPKYNNNNNNNNDTQNLMPVKYISIDKLFGSHVFNNNYVIDMLLIGAEGNDPSVLQGSSNVLKKTRYRKSYGSQF